MILRSPCAAVVSLLAVPFAVLAQGLPQARVSEIVDVTVANVDVVVTDAEGVRIAGLTRDDFELLENGQPKNISHFAEISAGPAAAGLPVGLDAISARASSPRRHVVIFVDLMTLRGARRQRAISSISAFLDGLGPEDERTIVSWDDTALRIEVPTDADRAAARAALEDLGRRRQHGYGPGRSANWRRVLLRMLHNQLERSVIAVRALLTQMKPLAGKKVLILVTEGFPRSPGEEVFRTPTFGDDTEAVRLYSEFQDQALQLLQSVVDAANAGGVTLYAIHGAGAAPNVAIGPLPVGGGLVLPGIGVRREAIDNSVDGLTLLAEGSGGLVAARTNDLNAAFGEIAADLSSYYSLGYRVEGELETERRIEIRMRDPKMRARSREAIVTRPLEQDVPDTVLANLALPRLEHDPAANDLGISAVVAEGKRSRWNRLTVPVDVLIPLESLSFIEEGDTFVANITIYIAAADSKKTLSEMKDFDRIVRLTRADFNNIHRSHYTYALDVQLRTRTAENQIALAVVDNTSGLTGYTVLDVGRATAARDRSTALEP